MKFVVTSQVGDTDPLPGTLRPIERPRIPGEAVMTRDFRLKRSGTDGCGRSIWEINGLHWDDITEYPELGTTEIWRFINDSNVSHPMHMHLVFFQILDRDGFTTGPGGEIIPDGNPQPPLAEENGWKDTAMVGPNEILRVIVRFEDYKGKYAYHCHILEHEDHEMMRQFQTVSAATPRSTRRPRRATTADARSTSTAARRSARSRSTSSSAGPARDRVEVASI